MKIVINVKSVTNCLISYHGFVSRQYVISSHQDNNSLSSDLWFQDFLSTLRHMEMCNMSTRSYYMYKYEEKTWQNKHGTIQKINNTINIHVYIYIHVYIGTQRLKTKRLLREQEKKFTSLLINKDRFLRSGTLQSESNPFILCYTILTKFTVHNIQCAVMTYPLWAPLEISLPANEEDLLLSDFSLL